MALADSDLDPVERIVDGLDPDQRRAVCAPVGPLIIHAGAGSGKTTVLTHRIAWRILDGSADPLHTLAITFTRQAAGELRRRLIGLGALDRVESPTVTTGTFHAVAWHLLQRHHGDIGKPPPQVAVNPAAIVAEVLPRGTRAGAAAVLAAIDWARARRLGPDDADTIVSARPGLGLDGETIAAVLTSYESRKRRRGVLDLNDMLARVVDLAAEDRTFAESIRWRHRHLHVDEAQDINPLQFAFLSVLIGDAGSGSDLFVVGDPNQAIYGWNGADRTLFDRLPESVGGATVLSLPSNYRCTPQVVDAAVHVLANSGQQTTAVSRRANGRPVTPVRNADEDEERRSVLRLVLDMVAQGTNESDIAVLTRTNRLGEEVAAYLAANGLEVRQRRATSTYLDVVAEVSELSGRHGLTAWASDVLDSTDRPDAFADDKEVADVARLVREFLSETVGAVDGRAFSSWLLSRQPEWGDRGVDVMTIHSAKGRQWRAVIVAGVEEGLLPHKSAKSPEALQEEGRLAYVAFTRAADELFISWTDRRSGRRTGPSPLLRRLQTGPERIVAPPDEIRADIRRRLRAPAPDPVLEALRVWRRDAARASRVAEQGVLSDRELSTLAQARPRTEDEVVAVLGPILGRRHSRRLLQVIASVESDGS